MAHWTGKTLGSHFGSSSIYSDPSWTSGSLRHQIYDELASECSPRGDVCLFNFFTTHCIELLGQPSHACSVEDDAVRDCCRCEWSCLGSHDSEFAKLPKSCDGFLSYFPLHPGLWVSLLGFAWMTIRSSKQDGWVTCERDWLIQDRAKPSSSSVTWLYPKPAKCQSGRNIKSLVSWVACWIADWRFHKSSQNHGRKGAFWEIAGVMLGYLPRLYCDSWQGTKIGCKKCGH